MIANIGSFNIAFLSHDWLLGCNSNYKKALVKWTGLIDILNTECINGSWKFSKIMLQNWYVMIHWSPWQLSDCGAIFCWKSQSALVCLDALVSLDVSCSVWMCLDWLSYLYLAQYHDILVELCLIVFLYLGLSVFFSHQTDVTSSELVSGLFRLLLASIQQ